MLLGVMAAASGIIYAVVKFLTTMRMRRLRETVARTQGNLQKAQQLVEVLADKQKVEFSKRKSVRRDVERARKRNEILFARLRSDLPANYLRRLDSCMDASKQSDSAEMEILKELKLADRITAALESLSLLLVEFAADEESQRTVTLGRFSEQLEQRRITPITHPIPTRSYLFLTGQPRRPNSSVNVKPFPNRVAEVRLVP